MSSKIEVKVIKPPVEKITSGRVFRPSKAFLHKMWMKLFVSALAIVLITSLGTISMAYFLAYVEPVDYPSPAALINVWLDRMITWTLILDLFWLIPALILTPVYVRSIEYSVKGESGETMPEVYVKKGFITITRNHVPFRAITNIFSQAGPFDRYFGIGSVNIETAGFSGSEMKGPEEKLEGIVFYEEVRDYILQELRRYRSPYVTTTETDIPDREASKTTPPFEKEVLSTLREIRDLLKTEK
jgi:membrane protein YdbS with pleckstrin-like domain